MKAKKLISSLLLLAVAGTSLSAVAVGCNKKPVSSGKTYYVSPTGTEGAAGTQEDPLNIYKLLNTTGVTELDILKPGDTVMVLPGEYEMEASQRIIMTVSGTHNNPITIKNADPTKKATLKFYSMPFSSLNRGVQIYGDYFVWDGVDIAGAGDNGMYIGGSYNVVQNCEFYDNRDTGLQLGRSYGTYTNINQWPHYNLIKNCTSYNNYDNETYGENADGFAAKLTVGYGNVFDGCIAYRNSDDGWDLYAKTDSGNIGQVIMYNCVAYENGYIMETQAEFNAKFPAFDVSFAEANTNSYTTRDGDGNGFKLGGSVMEGEVYLENCLSFHNRMHGVTDNSNPGVITVTGVTSYNNAASVDNNSANTQTFGYIKYGGSGGEGDSANIDLARQTYSYNHVANTLSVSSSANTTVVADAYRGTVENSKLWGPNTTYTISGQDEYNTKTGDKGTAGAMLVATDVFVKLPEMNMGVSVNAHSAYRNEDGSVNMGNILAQKDSSSTYGSFLNKSSWEEYNHFDYAYLNNCADSDDATATAVQKMLYVPVREEAVYQNFKAVTKMLRADITWTSSDENVLKVTDIKGTSYSLHEDVLIEVNRPADADKIVTLTATVKMGNYTKKKSFEINVKKNTYRIGEFVIDGLDNNGTMIVDRGETKFDYRIKAPEVVNDTSNNGAIINSQYYTRDTYYKYSTDKNPDFSASASEGKYEYRDSFDARDAGIWEITETVTLKGVTLAKSADGSTTAPSVQSKSYRIFVAATDAEVSFSGEPTITVNRDGFSIEGEVSSPTGTLYVKVVEKGAAAPTAQQIVDTGVANEFRATNIFFNIKQTNESAYDIYYVMKNVDGNITTTTPGKQTVEVSEITTKAQFEAMLTNNNSTTIYKLMNDIDFGGSLATTTTAFVGVFNGMGYKLSNVTLTNTTDTKHDNIPGEGIFRLVRGGTVMNVTFENIVISDVGPKTGIIALMYGGYVSNVKVHNISVTSSQRVGGVIGQIIAESSKSSTTYVDRVEVINDDEFVEASGLSSLNFEGGKYYELVDGKYVRCDKYKENTKFYQKKWAISGARVGGVVGFIQAGSANGHNVVYISDCYVYARLESSDYCGGILGRSDDRNAADELYITNCYYNGDSSCLVRSGGILGGFTGTGLTRVKGCLSTGSLYYANPRELVVVAQKNCSGIIGNFAGNADMKVESCIALFEEYNTDYDVDTALTAFLEDRTRNYFLLVLGFDMENVWEYVDSEDGSSNVAPYVKLR